MRFREAILVSCLLTRTSQISWGSRTVFNFAEAYAKIASEQHGGHPIPERLPTEREVGELLSNVNYLKQNLENLRELVQHSIQTEKAREGGRAKGPYDGDDDVSMYGDGMKQPYNMGEVKKRRGVSFSIYLGRPVGSLFSLLTSTYKSVLRHLADATAVIGSIHQNGEEGQMGRGLSVTHAVSTTPS